MLIRLKSGLRIAISPIFPWESRKADVLKIQSFGAFHPDHVTTRLCLDLLEWSLTDHACGSVLDVGCGTGILALAASRLKVPSVVGFDLNHQAVRSSVRNAEANGLRDNPCWFVGTVSGIAKSFDCVVVNIPFHAICEILEDLLPLINPDGRLILSGFQDIHWSPLSKELMKLGFSMRKLLSGDRSFYGIPPSGSFTWMAVLLDRARVEKRAEREGK